MKVTFEFPDSTKAAILSYITEKGGAMFLNLKNISTPELSSGETIKLPPENQETEV